MKKEAIRSLFLKHKEDRLHHRYITNNHIEPLMEHLAKFSSVEIIGKSVLEAPIYAIKIGNGSKRVLMWSQMHGNEATTTKALFDVLNTLLDINSKLNYMLEECTLYIIPILNPDGASAYTRINANNIDLNRDAQDLSQPESHVLRSAFNDFRPHYCYNLHGQRTIFSAGNKNKPATVSFLAPAQDEECTITKNRTVAMEIIGEMNAMLQDVIPGHVGVYDDTFNINCVGDTFQKENVPTILFEAGHIANDYAREMTREYIYISLLVSLDYIATHTVEGNNYKTYFEIPENEKLFFDVIIRNAEVKIGSKTTITDIGILFVEKLIAGRIQFIPKVDKIEVLSDHFGHKEFDARKSKVLDIDSKPVQIGDENVFVIVDNEKIALFS